jgi:integrase
MPASYKLVKGWQQEVVQVKTHQTCAVLASCLPGGDRLEALYVLAIHTGLRRSEILGIKWTDVDLEAGILSVQRSLDTKGTFNPPKRNKSRRTVKLTDQATEALKGHRARQNEERLRLGSL